MHPPSGEFTCRPELYPQRAGTQSNADLTSSSCILWDIREWVWRSGVFQVYVVDQAGFVGRNQPSHSEWMECRMFQDRSWQKWCNILHYLCKTWEGGALIDRHCSNFDEHLSHGHYNISPPALQQFVCYCQMIKDMVFEKKFHGGTGMEQQLWYKAEKGMRTNLNLYTTKW